MGNEGELGGEKEMETGWDVIYERRIENKNKRIPMLKQKLNEIHSKRIILQSCHRTIQNLHKIHSSNLQ